MKEIHFVIPGSIDSKTGGTRYDRRIIEGLRSSGYDIVLHQLPGDYPHPVTADRKTAGSTFDGIPDGSFAVVDGLVLGTIPDIASDQKDRLHLIGLVHHPLFDESGEKELLRTEREALIHVNEIIVTSEFTKKRILDIGLADDDKPIFVVEPGVDPAPVSPDHNMGEPFSLISVGAIIDRKSYSDLLKALYGLRDLDWSWTCIGRTDQKKEAANKIMKLAEDLDLSDRVFFTGEVSDEEMGRLFVDAHLLVHPARYEGYGMVIMESISRGVPVVASSGGALGDTVPNGAGILFSPGDTKELENILRKVMTDGRKYGRIREGALRSREGIRSWEEAAGEFESVIKVGMSDFDQDWLELRFPADEKAREGVTDQLLDFIDPGKSMSILDLGAGSGNNAIHLIPRLEKAGVKKQRWLLVDRDRDLLNRGLERIEEMAEGHGEIDPEIKVADLSEDLDGIPFSDHDMVVGSAILDLVSVGWSRSLVDHLNDSGVKYVLFSMTVDGKVGWIPEHPLDGRIMEEFLEDMKRDKGFGPAMGSGAPEEFRKVLGDGGFDVVEMETPWKLDQDKVDLQRRYLQGVFEAVRSGGEGVGSWMDRRLSYMDSNESGLTVGHVDLLGIKRNLPDE